MEGRMSGKNTGTVMFTQNLKHGCFSKSTMQVLYKYKLKKTL